MATKLYVGGLSYNTKNEGLKEFFASQGNVVSADVIIDKFTNKSRGFGFVEMETAEEAQAAIDNLNGKDLDGRAISVNVAREKTEGGDRGGNRGGGFRPGGRSGGGGYGGQRGGNNNGGGSFRFR
ncbi:MAG: RNA-binding protein [Candidatus Nomurabacteria bacterium]|jgi:RNA recognition motif-containing protein|nr:RNA-binding protein [Candidatus Nomurabacteria bacterium]